MWVELDQYPASNYTFKVSNRNTRTTCEICSKLTIKTLRRRHWRNSGVFIVNFEHVSHLVLVFLLSPVSRLMPAEYYCLQWKITQGFLALISEITNLLSRLPCTDIEYVIVGVSKHSQNFWSEFRNSNNSTREVAFF